MRRGLSSVARTFLQYIWKGTNSYPEYEQMLDKKVKQNSRLSKANKVEFAGDPHTSEKDEKKRASGQIFQDQMRLTSVHVYIDGTVEYSKKSYNDAQE
ncbi:hypothetical protein BDV25DRAFT_138777 [Aspergillus avenaceus]|uniref:Uncharacterized protein n=1 Tax=Aspergillus avenaceus TaxID=36643 RepID=A0A5N6TYT2_ASPAV|nr:hypothetical protein BDV25DRAFT_138777 [Aspergillus avenaceus]